MSQHGTHRKIEVVCAWCNKHQNAKGKFVELTPLQWKALEGKPISHGICPECMAKCKKDIETETEFLRKATLAFAGSETSALAEQRLI